jgi:hypothetical protein
MAHNRVERLDLRRGVRRALAASEQEEASAYREQGHECGHSNDANPLTHVVSIGIARVGLDGKR